MNSAPVRARAVADGGVDIVGIGVDDLEWHGAAILGERGDRRWERCQESRGEVVAFTGLWRHQRPCTDTEAVGVFRAGKCP